MNTNPLALKHITSLALQSVVNSPVTEQIKTYEAVAVISKETLPELSKLAAQTADAFKESNEKQLELFQLTQTPAA